MPSESDRFEEYLVPGEPLVATSTATLSGTSPQKPVSIGITDRRLVYLADDGGFAHIDYDAISTIRSRPRTTRTYRGTDHRLLLGGGGLAAILGFVGVVALSRGVLVPLLSLLAIGGLVLAESLRRNADGTEVGVAAAIAERVPSDFADLDVVPQYRSDLTGLTDRADERRVLLFASGFVAVAGLLGSALLASSWFVVSAMLASIGGVALIDYARRHRDEFDGIEVVRHHETEVSITTDGGRTIHIRSDRSEAIDRELSRVAFTDPIEPRTAVSSRS